MLFSYRLRVADCGSDIPGVRSVWIADRLGGLAFTQTGVPMTARKDIADA